MFALADLKLNRLLETFDGWAHDRADVGEPERFEPTRAPESSRVRLDLGSGEIRTILWATGFRPDYSWLHVPVVDPKGNIRHDGGVVVDSPGMVVLGLPVLRRRRSSFINGAEDDARDVVEHLAGYLAGDAEAGGRSGRGAVGVRRRLEWRDAVRPCSVRPHVADPHPDGLSRAVGPEGAESERSASSLLNAAFAATGVASLVMPTRAIKALVPTAIAAVLLSQEFTSAALDTDGTLFTVVIYGVSYSDAIAAHQWLDEQVAHRARARDRRRDVRAAPVRSGRAQATDVAPPVSTLSCVRRVPGPRRPRHTRLQVSQLTV